MSGDTWKAMAQNMREIESFGKWHVIVIHLYVLIYKSWEKVIHPAGKPKCKLPCCGTDSRNEVEQSNDAWHSFKLLLFEVGWS